MGYVSDTDGVRMVDRRQLCDAIPGAALVFDETGRVLHANREAGDLLGLVGGRLPLVTALFSGVDLPAQLLGRRSLALEARREDGERLSVEVSAGFPGPSGDVVVLVAPRVDRPDVDTLLSDREERYRTVVEALGAGVVLSNAAGHSQAANESACRILGVSMSEILKADAHQPFSVTSLDGTCQAPPDYPHMRALRTGETQNGEVIKVRRPDGDYVWLYVHSQPIFKDPVAAGPHGVISTFVDVTDEHRAKDLLQQTLERYEQVFGTSPLGMALVTGDGGFVEVNRALCELLGYDSTQLRELGLSGVSAGTVTSLFSGDDPWAAGVTRQRPEHRYVRADGRVVDTLTHCSRISGEHSSLAQYFISVQDVTELKGLEKQLFESQKLDAIGQLTGGIAHDFNNLIMVMSGHLEDLLDDGVLVEHAGNHLFAIQRAADRAATLVDGLMSFSRHQTFHNELLCIDAMVKAEMEMVARLIGEDVGLALDLGCPNATAFVDRARLSQVILNLVLNARSAMPEGGTLTIRTRRVGPHGDSMACGFIHIEVEDTGTGMDPEVLSHVFEPFFTTKPRGTGTGLGLSTAHGIVAQSGGTLTVDSELDRGSTFRIALPASPLAPPKRSTVGQTPQPRQTGTILVVEGEVEVREIMSETLRDYGHVVLEAGDSAQALDLARRLEEDLQVVVADVGMPRVDGARLCHQLRTDRPGLGVVLVSGYAGDALAGRNLPVLGCELLAKPFSRWDLLRAVEAVLTATAEVGR